MKKNDTDNQPDFYQPFHVKKNDTGNLPCEPEMNDQQPCDSSLKTFFSLSGGSILYCLSLLSIIYGLARIITPVLMSTDDTWTRLLCIGVLNGYELAVLGVLLLIVLWRNVLDDAISLVIIITILLTANAVTVNLVVMDNILAGFPVGLTGLALAAANVVAFRKYLLMRLEPLFLTGLCAMLAWSMLMPSVMAFMVQNEFAHGTALRNAWLAGWVITISGGALWWLHTVRIPNGESLEKHINTPFLRTPGMTWIFGALIFAGVTVQQYVLTYVFDLNFSPGAVLPIIAVSCLIGVELLHSYKAEKTPPCYFIALFPMLACLYVYAHGFHIEGPEKWIAPFWNPPWLMALVGIGLAVTAYFRRNKRMWIVVSAYAIALWMTWGTIGGEGFASLKWIRALILVELGLIVFSIRLRNPYLAVMAWIGVGLALCVTDIGIAFTNKLGFKDGNELGIMLALAGILSTEAIFKRCLPPLFSLITASLLVAYALKVFGDQNIPIPYPWTSALVLVVLGGLIAWRAKNYMVATLLSLPLLRMLYYVAQNLASWGYVILSFPLLAAGAYLSLRKGRLNRTTNKQP